jgi:membrane-associated phospholipid phosphatase
MDRGNRHRFGMIGMSRIGATVLLLGCALAMAAPPVQAENTRLTVDPLTDGIVLGSGLVFAAASEILLPLLPPVRTIGPADITQVNGLDRTLMDPYSAGLDFTSTLLQYASAALPLALAYFVPREDLIPMGVVYLESLSFAVGAKNILKYLIPRYRPYVYLGGAPGVSTTDDDQSFPSGHATVAFAAAAAGVSLFDASFPRSPYFWPFTAGCYGLAILTATFRVASGMHFLTDVLAGAALGSLCGYLIPFLHERASVRDGESRLSFDFGPTGMMVRCTL